MFITIKKIPPLLLTFSALLIFACNEKTSSTGSSTDPSTEDSKKSAKDKTESDSPVKTDDIQPPDETTKKDNSKKKPDSSKEATEKVSASSATTKLTVESAGEEARHLLRYNLQAGMVAIYSGEIRQLTTAPQPVGAFEVVYRFKLRQEFGKAKQIKAQEKATAPGFEITYSLEDVKIDFPERLKIKSDILEQTLNRTSFKALISPRGHMERLADSLKGNKPTHEKHMEELSNTLPKLNPIYPKDPVGRGAIWTLVTSLPMTQQTGLAKSSLLTKISTRYKADSITEVEQGRAMNLEINTKVTLDGSSSGMKVQGEGGGKGSTSILLKTGLVHSYKNLVKVVTKIKDQEASNTTAVNLKLISLN